MRSKPRPITIYELRRHRFGDMPPLSHWPDKSRHFHWSSSEVCRWLAVIEPNVSPRKLFEQAQDAQAIVFDKETGLWRGCYYVTPEVAPGRLVNGVELGGSSATAASPAQISVAPVSSETRANPEGEVVADNGGKLKLRQRDLRQIAATKVGREFLLASGAIDERWFAKYSVRM